MSEPLLERLRERVKSIDKKTAIVGAAVGTGIMTLSGAGAYYSPYLAVNSLQSAAEHRNPGALSQEINFPELRNNFKATIKAQAIEQIKEAKTVQVSSANVDRVERTIDSLVDKLVTPEGIEQLLLDKFPSTKIDLSNLDKDVAKSQITMGYESFDRFVVHIINKVDRTQDVSLILTRDGIGWKLSKIDISKLGDRT
ncbi:DUF2939 domain-containing protein [Chamaesiphon sp. VAR_69_metabat_338]|uniref:DUF2939 domain-containing protein n=1 Tax=Chamaesiphon sp. VAR_69_metabat_338 TaxID=2964704 RepID=UPI00286DC1FA|nr:DUF2939 domain-containing protein [Chamaesiphon sp. VAR_69_metabat_338]